MYVSDAKIEDSSFEMNVASEESKNLFIGFSNVTIKNCKFIDDTKYDNAH